MMNITISVRVFLVFIMLTFTYVSSIAQSVTPLTVAERKNYVLTIDQESIRKHEVIHRKNQPSKTGWLLTARLFNNSNDTLKYVTMSCSWYDNFRLSNNEMQIKGWGCDSNFPIIQKVLPRKPVSFNITVICPDTLQKSGAGFKIGMVIIKDYKEYEVLVMKNDMNLLYKNLIWSNSVEIPK